MLGIGIDTGGTCTDAVIYNLETKEILGAGKALTTKSNLEIGISNALDTLPKDLLEKAEILALSTTLATNACVENKGARAKLLMLGFEASMMERLKDIYASYGFTDMSQFIIMEAKVENLFPDAFDPDWDTLKAKAKEYFADCDSVGIVQKHPRANGGRFELTARELLKEEINHPITIAYDISNEIDILKTCAGTMLNARLIPLISEFMEAVHHVMEKKNLHIPLSIVRSDGTLMSEEMAKTYPVETLLCGPAASVVGGSTLSNQESAIILDMGGTTTDIAIIRNQEPVMAKSGIQIGQWNTMVKGLYVDTFGLGGDSAVRFDVSGNIYLDTVRVIPISILASEYDIVLPKLEELYRTNRVHSKWIYEFYVLQKDISEKSGYTELEQQVCSYLKDGPLITMDLAKKLKTDPHYLRLDRLERDGIIMKSGLTPTDMMTIKGDFVKYDKAAAMKALECMVMNVRESIEEIPDLVYDLVVKKMYKNLGRIILQQEYPKDKSRFSDSAADTMLEYFYQQAKEREAQTASSDEAAATSHSMRNANLILTTDYPLIGVGAPIHVFLPRVAQLLGTTAIVPEYSGVANAIGAISSRIIARSQLTLKAEYNGLNFLGFSVFDEGKRYLYRNYDEAEAAAKEVLTKKVTQRAHLQGIEHPTIEIHEVKNTSQPGGKGVFFETILYALGT